MNTENIILGAMYISDNGNDEGVSENIGNMHNFAEKNNITIVEKYIDKNRGREDLERLLKDIQNQTLELDVLLVTDVNNLGLGSTNQDVTSQLQELGIDIISTD